MRSIAALLIYAAILLRAAAEFVEAGEIQGEVVLLLAAFGLVLAAGPPLTRRLSGRPYYYLYLLLQSVLVLGLLFAAPDMDFLPTLFIPLSYQAVKFLKAPLGFIWVGAYSLVMSVPLLMGWSWTLPGVAQVLLYTGLNLLVGSYALWIERAGQAQQENQRLLAEMEKAHRQLQDYAAQVEEIAAAQERSHLARELHDSVTQTLFSMNLTVQAARMLVQQEPARVAGQLDRLQELSRSAAGEIQVLARHLQPRPLAAEGLPAALRRLAAERERRDGLQVRLELNGCASERRLSEPTTAGLYRIVQEALNNVAKHAGTCEAVVRLELDRQPAYLEVEDWGAGFDLDRIPRGISQIGLKGIAERAGEIGWTLRIDSQPGRGTRIRLEEAEIDRIGLA